MTTEETNVIGLSEDECLELANSFQKLAYAKVKSINIQLTDELYLTFVTEETFADIEAKVNSDGGEGWEELIDEEEE